MAITSAQVNEAASRWGLAATAGPAAERLAAYGNLLLQWNARLSLTAIREEAEFVERHLMEGVFAAAYHPPGTTSLDFGSGTGVPGIPIALCRPDLRVILAESQRKKAAFLREAIRKFRTNAVVHAARAESLPSGSFDTVWMRAVDKTRSMLPLAAGLLTRSGGSLCLLGVSTLHPDLPGEWSWETTPLPESQSRVLHIGRLL